MTPKGIEQITGYFRHKFDSEPIVVRSPGRINLIGEHTDYNQGMVLPAAVDKEIVIAVGASDSNTVQISSYDLNEALSFEVHDIPPSAQGWSAYIIGVIDQFIKAGATLDGFNCVFGGDIPIGAGLSSSAAVECGVAFALNQLFDLGFNKQQLVEIAQNAENQYVGVQCGIMDQFANIHGKTNHAIKLDCRSLEHEYYELRLQGFRLILFDTQVKHNLADTEYNQRKLECEQAVSITKEKYPDVKSLRDCTIEMIRASEAALGPLLFRRSKFIIEENLRVEEGCRDLKAEDLESFGEKMYASHNGLKNEYEVSCQELDFLVDQCKDNDQVIGARMMGGGFGGCTLNLVKDENVDDLVNQVAAAYKKAMNLNLKAYRVKIASGTSLIENVPYSI